MMGISAKSAHGFVVAKFTCMHWGVSMGLYVALGIMRVLQCEEQSYNSPNVVLVVEISCECVYYY